MSLKLQLATVLAIAISASGTASSVQAGGFGGFKIGGSGGGGSHSNHGSHGHNHHHSSGGFKFGGNSNFNNQGNKVLPKNTGIAGGITRIGGTGIKLPGVGTIGSSNTNKGPGLSNVLTNTTTVKNLGVIQSSNALKNVSDKLKSPSVQQKVLGSIGIGGSHHHDKHDHHDHHHGHHNHGHHHHCPPLVFTLPACQPNYCPPPCPPIYYPLPVAVPVPAADPNAVPVNPNAVPAAETGLPMETKQALEDVVATEAPAANSQPAVQQATATEPVSKEVSLPQIPVGATLTLQGKDLTDKEGQVVLQFGEIALPATIKEWKNDAVTCTLPVLGLTRPSKATLHVLKSDGKTASTLNCEIVTTLPTSVEARSATTSDIEAAKYEQ